MLEGYRLEILDLEPTTNCNAGQDSLVTSLQTLGYVLDYLEMDCCRVKSYDTSPNIQTACTAHTAS